jgi:hypothetical protein
MDIRTLGLRFSGKGTDFYLLHIAHADSYPVGSRFISLVLKWAEREADYSFYC